MKKALIVDDAEANRILFGAIISKLGVAVDYAADGEEAIQKFIVFKPDIVIIDQIMPNKNGSDAIKQMKFIKPDFTAILMSALASKEEVNAIVKSCGAEEFLPKPVSFSMITEVLKKYNIIS